MTVSPLASATKARAARFDPEANEHKELDQARESGLGNASLDACEHVGSSSKRQEEMV